MDKIVNNTRSLFHRYGVKIVRYADDFVLMGRSLPVEVKAKLENLPERMGLALNAEKTHHIDARKKSFDFLGFTVRYSRDLFVKGRRYWEAFPSKRAEQKIREKIHGYLKTHGYSSAEKVSEDLNAMLRGWLNYFEIPKVSYTKMAKRRLRYFLSTSLYRYYNRKSQRKSRLYGQQAFEVLTARYGLIDPTKYSLGLNKL
ncbi:group II intron maturase-specific domain-containing protein [Negadavirga shengliensis]|uniref:Group II intron maturase-specific domain-containing protein n=1 Tax=Negadavirga shengliensis TaxID=1389218 RepID=A0ABV9SWT7_9BACT